MPSSAKLGRWVGGWVGGWVSGWVVWTDSDNRANLSSTSTSTGTEPGNTFIE